MNNNDNAQSRMRLGMLGAARIGRWGIVLPSWELEGVELHAVAARDHDRANSYARRHKIPTAYGSYQALIDDPSIDAVYNPLPNGLHGYWTLQALAAGKHVLCEKPLAANADEARQIQAASLRHQRVVMEAMHYRFHPLAQRICEHVATLGTLERIEASMCVPLPMPGDIRYRFDLAGGASMDTGIYTASLLRLVASVDPALRDTAADILSADPVLRSEQIDRAMTAELRWPNGATARLENSLWSRRLLKISLRVVGQRGELRVLNPVAPHIFHKLRIEKDGKVQRERVPGKSTYTCQLQAFVERIAAGPPRSEDLADAIATQELVDAIYLKAGMQLRQPTRA